jgi:hypothetical protein
MLEDGKLVHQEGSLRLFEVPGRRMKPYPGIEHLAGAPRLSPFRLWMVRMLGVFRRA